MPRKRAKTPKKKNKLEEKDWSNVLGGLSQEGNNLIHHLQLDNTVDLMDTSKEQKFVLNTTSEEEIDDGRFIKAWNKAGILLYLLYQYLSNNI